jgi:VanZ family protein
MPAHIPIPPRGDRTGDQRAVFEGVPKPPVLSRATLRLLCVACLAVVVYGTLGSLGSSSNTWIVPVEHWRWVPPRLPSDLNDVLTNLAVYFPVGVSFRLLVRRRGRAGWRDLLLGEILSLVLSYATEVFQQAMPDRASSRTDILINGVGALIGGLCAASAQQLIRRVHAFVFLQVRVPWRRWTLLAWLAAAAIAMLMTMPWELRRPAAESGFGRALVLPDVGRFAMFLALTFFTTGARRLRGCAGLSAWVGALLLVAPLIGMLEAAQAVLRQHVCSLSHALIALAGAALGCLAAITLLRPETGGRPASPRQPECPPSPRMRKVALVALAVTIAYAAIAGLWEPVSHGHWRAAPLVQWTPFQAHFAAPFPAAAADVFQQLAVYALLTLSCLYITLGQGRAVALLLLAGLLGLIEGGRAFLGGYGADTTAPLLAAVAWLVTTRIWQSVHPAYPNQPDCSA